MASRTNISIATATFEPLNDCREAGESWNQYLLKVTPYLMKLAEKMKADKQKQKEILRAMGPL